MTIKNLAASVHARLTERARKDGRPFQELLEYFAMERFLYRLSSSPHADRFVLKGALMLRVWDAPTARPTRDIDLLGRMENSPENLARVVAAVCDAEVEPDGLVFKGSTVKAIRIKEDADYEGVRVRFDGLLERARVPMQIDVGFGDIVVPAAQTIGYPTLLDFPAPTMKGYPRETVVAEKFEAMVKLGTLNSRMKDFFDIWLMARQFDFNGALLARARGDLDLRQPQDGDRSGAGCAHAGVHRKRDRGYAVARVRAPREVHPSARAAQRRRRRTRRVPAPGRRRVRRRQL